MFRKLYGKQFDKPYLRKLDNTRNFSEISPGSSRQDAGEVWGGAFWEIRGLLKQNDADKLLFATWVTLRPSDAVNEPGANFVNALLEAAQSLQGGKYDEQIRSVFERRGAIF